MVLTGELTVAATDGDVRRFGPGGSGFSLERRWQQRPSDPGPGHEQRSCADDRGGVALRRFQPRGLDASLCTDHKTRYFP